MKIIYRISDSGYKKLKPEYVNNESCLKNFCDVFFNYKHEIYVIADNCNNNTINMIEKYIDPVNIEKTSIGNGAGTFNLALDKALKLNDTDIVYFVENDYLHLPSSDIILKEGIDLNASFISLYDHPDKYMTPEKGGNPYCISGGEDTIVYLTASTHWKMTNSTTMTFASKVSTLKKFEYILRKHTSTNHPYDFAMWLELRANGASLMTPIPGYSTHGEMEWLSPLIQWKNVNSNT
jgi:hypothetical protein